MKRLSSPHTVDFPSHGLFTLESPHSSTFHMPEQSWSFHKLCWVGTGKGVLKSESVEHPLSMGDFFWVHKGTPHRFVDHPEAPMTLVVVCVQSALFSASPHAELLDQFLALQRSLQVFRPHRYAQEKIRDDLRSMLVEQYLQKPGWPSATLATFYNLLVYLIRVIPQRDRDNSQDRFYDTVTHIEENFYRELHTRDLAVMCDVSERTYSGWFRQRMGMTVTAYIRECRLNYAKERLVETENIAYSAYESGFSDLTHFYRVFKKNEGMPPGEFIQQATQK